MANKYRRKLQEAYGYADDSRTFEQVYGDDADQLFEGYEVPEKFKKLFEAEKAKNARLGKKLNEMMELMLHSTDKVIKGKAAAWREKAKATMLDHVGKDVYSKLTESINIGTDGWDGEDEDFGAISESRSRRRRVKEMNEWAPGMDGEDFDPNGDSPFYNEEDLEAIDDILAEDEDEYADEDALGIADEYEDEDEPDWDDGPLMSDDLEF